MNNINTSLTLQIKFLREYYKIIDGLDYNDMRKFLSLNGEVISFIESFCGTNLQYDNTASGYFSITNVDTNIELYLTKDVRFPFNHVRSPPSGIIGHYSFENKFTRMIIKKRKMMTTSFLYRILEELELDLSENILEWTDEDIMAWRMVL